MSMMNTQEAAQYLTLSPRTLEAYRLRKKGPRYVRISRNTVRYKKEDLDKWLNKLRSYSRSSITRRLL